MEKIIEEKERQGSKFLQWVWLGILFFVFLEIPRLLTFLFISGMFGSVQNFFVVADEKADGQMDKWSYLTALAICTILAFGFGFPLPGLVMVGLTLATVFELYLLHLTDVFIIFFQVILIHKPCTGITYGSSAHIKHC